MSQKNCTDINENNEGDYNHDDDDDDDDDDDGDGDSDGDGDLELEYDDYSEVDANYDPTTPKEEVKNIKIETNQEENKIKI